MPTTVPTLSLIHIDGLLAICDKVRNQCVDKLDSLPDEFARFAPFWRPMLEGITFTTFWRRSNRFLGWAHYSSGLIEINYRIYCDNYNAWSLYETIIHEIAHILTPGQGHNEAWDAVNTLFGGSNTPVDLSCLPYDHKLGEIHRLHYKLKDLHALER